MKGRLIHASPSWKAHSSSQGSNILPGTAATTTEEWMMPIQISTPSANTTNDKKQRSGTEIPESQLYRVVVFLLACGQNSLMGGLIYGWPALSKLLTEPALPNGGCGLSLPQTTVLFAVASVTGMISTLVLGYVLDMQGPRVCSVVSHLFIVVGCIGFAQSHSMIHYGISFCCIGFGGPGIGVSIVHLANLFPNHQFTALSLLNGSMSISMSVFVFFGILWDAYSWITYSDLFQCFGILVTISLLASWMVWPDYSFKAAALARHAQPTVEDDYIAANSIHQRWMTEQPLGSGLRDQPGLERSNSFLISKKAMENGLTNQVSLKDAPFWTQFSSGYYLRGNLFFLIVCFWANFYVASVTMELADTNVFSVKEQNLLMQLFGMVLGGGVVASFVIGIIMDHSGVEVATIWTIGLAIVHQIILLLVNERSEMLVGFVFYVFYRQFLFPVSIAMITSRLGFKYFGLLNGIGFLLSGLAQILMVPMVKLSQGTCHMFGSADIELVENTCEHGKWNQLHLFELFTLALLFLVPMYDYRDKRAEKQQLKQLALMRSSWRMLYGGSYGSTASMSPLLGRSSVSSMGSYGSNSPSMSRLVPNRLQLRDPLDEETDEEVLEF